MATSSPADTPEQKIAEPPARRRFLQFSLLSFLLVVSMICVVVSHYRVARERDLVKQKNDQLMTEIGYLVVHDPTKIYIRKLEATEDLTWRFRVHLPIDRTYTIFIRTDPGSSNGFGYKPTEEQFTLSFALRRNAKGAWQLLSMWPGINGTGGCDSSVAAKLVELQDSTVRQDQQELDPNKPHDLVRLVNDRFHIWIEPDKSDGRK